MNIYIKTFLTLSTLIIAIVIIRSIFWKDTKPNTESSVEIDLPYNFKTDTAEKLSVTAFDFKKQGQYDRAIKLYNQAIKIEPDNPILYFDLSECYFGKDELSLAINCLNYAINIDSTFYGLYNNRGLYYYRLMQDEKAIADFEKAVQLNNQSADLFYNLALGYLSTNQSDKACVAYNQAQVLGLDMHSVKNQNEFKKLMKLCR